MKRTMVFLLIIASIVGNTFLYSKKPERTWSCSQKPPWEIDPRYGWQENKEALLKEWYNRVYRRSALFSNHFKSYMNTRHHKEAFRSFLVASE